MFSATTKVSPDDLASVRAVLKELLEAGRSDEAVDTAVALLSQLRAQNTELMLRVAALRRRQHRSEKVDPKQLALLLAEHEQSGDGESTSEEPADDDREAELQAAREENRQKKTKRKPRSV